jgi:VCBS repeat-containing protein
LGVGVNRWTGTLGVTGNGANQNDMFRALLAAGAYIDRITCQRESGSGFVTLSVTDAGSQTLLQTGGTGALYVYNPPSQNSILNFMVITDFNPAPKNWTVTVNVIGSVQGSSGPLLTFESASPPQVNIAEGNSGTACGRFSDRERDAVTTLVTVVQNSVPVANDQSISTDEDTPITTTFTTSDVNGDSLTYSVVSAPGNGSLSGTPPTVTYTPNANYAGVDSFTFKANDGEADSQVATITITVNPVNDTPLANDDSFNTDEDTSLSGSVAGNDSDIDGDMLAYSLVTNANYGALTLNPDGSFIYTPTYDYNGLDSFTYQAHDGNNGTDTATVKITVSALNDAPKVINDSAATVEDAAVTVTVMTNDNDSTDGGLLNPASVSVISGPTSGATSVNAINGTITYTLSANFYGSDSFTYRICDNGIPLPALCGSTTVTLVITAVTDDDDDGDGVADMNDAFPLDANDRAMVLPCTM